MLTRSFLKALLLASGLFTHLAPRAQTSALQVNLPAQIHLCGQADTARLAAAVSGGLAPYRYTWSMEPVHYLSDTFHASHYLDDTTRARPLLWPPDLDSLYLRFTLRDSLGAEAGDSLLVTHSQMMTHLGQIGLRMGPDDTLQLPNPNVDSSYPLDSVEWSPARGLVDRHALRPMASPDSNVAYRVQIWDTQGCSWAGGEFVFVSVSEVGLKEEGRGSFSIYPTLLRMGEAFQVRFPVSGAYVLGLRDAQGRPMATWRGTGKAAELKIPELPAGLYFLRYESPDHKGVEVRKIRLR